MIFSGLSNILTMQKRTEDAQENKTNSFEVAESGLNYYTWHLAHFPTDLQDGTDHGVHINTHSVMVPVTLSGNIL